MSNISQRHERHERHEQRRPSERRQQEQPRRRRRPAGRPLHPWPGGRGGGVARPLAGPRPLGVPPVQPVADFDTLGHYAMFGDADFPHYLRRTESQLRTLVAQGLEVHLRVLDPADFADFCAVHGLAPQDASARVAYAADPELAGEPFVCDGTGLAELLPDLVADQLARMRISVAQQALLDGIERAGWTGEALERRLTEVSRYVGAVRLALLSALDGGCHRLVLRVDGRDPAREPGGRRTVRGAEALTVDAEFRLEPDLVVEVAREVEAFCVTLAAGVVGARAGALVVHSTCPDDERAGRSGRGRGGTVRGWALAEGRLEALEADGVRELLGRLPDRSGDGGLPGPVRVRPGFALPEPPQGREGPGARRPRGDASERGGGPPG